MRSSFAPPAAESPSPGRSAHAGRVCRPLSPAPAPVGIRTAIETAGDSAFDRFLPVAEACNEVLFDFKIMEPERARSLLRMNQPRVLDNFRQLAARKINLIPRVPLIPGYTLNTDNFRQILAFLALSR